MPLASDFMGVGVAAEEALREGDIIAAASTGASAQSTGATIGGPTAANILRITPSASGAAVTFLSTTELDRNYTLVNETSLACNVWVPSGGNWHGTVASVFSLPASKVAYVTRITNTEWIYAISN